MERQEKLLGAYVRGLAEGMRTAGRFATARHYEAAAGRLLEYLGTEDVPMRTVTADTVEGFNGWMRARGLKPNTQSFYNRALRAVFNRARTGWGTELFGGVYTGNDKTAKRSVPSETVRSIRLLKAETLSSGVALARDLFLFSVYACGISFVDMVYLTQENVQEGFLVYTRRKTGRRITVRITEEMADILTRYAPQSKGYLFPFLDRRRSAVENYRRYCSALVVYNRNLKELGRLVGRRLSSYTARHTWASIAYREAGSPVSVISAALGHTSERTTRIYLSELDSIKVVALQETVAEILDSGPGDEKSLSLGKSQTSSREVTYIQ